MSATAASASEADPLWSQHESSLPGGGDEDSWKPRDAFKTAEGFVVHATRYLARLWARCLADGTLAAALKAEGSEGGAGTAAMSSTLLSEKAAGEAARSAENFGLRLSSGSLPSSLVERLAEMLEGIGAREYARANQVYMDISIGSKKWQTGMPVFVSFSMARQDTEVKWTPDCGSNPVDEAGVREHVVALRRLLAVAQAVRPNADPSRRCG